jgi:hypothetical protein
MPFIASALIFFVAGYILLMVAVYFGQRGMLYFPDKKKPQEEQVRALGLTFWPDVKDAHRGFTVDSPGEAKYQGLIVVFHGNAGSAAHRSYYIPAMHRLGYRVVLAEYPSYGGRDGELGEASFVRDAVETVKRAHLEFGGPVILLGESLGCAIAAAVAANPPVPIMGVILITPWDSLPDLAQSLYWYFPARWLVRDRYDNVRNLSGFDGPVAVLVAEQDEIIPWKHSMRLYDSLKPPKRLWVFKKAGHNSWPTAAAETWWGEVMRFLKAN